MTSRWLRIRSYNVRATVNCQMLLGCGRKVESDPGCSMHLVLGQTNCPQGVRQTLSIFPSHTLVMKFRQGRLGRALWLCAAAPGCCV